MAKEQKEKHDEIVLCSLDQFKPINNYILCRKKYKNRDARSFSGIYLFNEQYNKNQWLSNNVDRVYEVIVLPKCLTNKRWITEVELEKGDIIIISQIEAANCPKVIVNKEEYYLIDYYCIKVAKRKDDKGEIQDDGGRYKVVPINGNVICEDVIKTEKIGLFEKKTIDMPYGKVKWVGRKNNGYSKIVNGDRIFEDRDYGVDVKPGDTVFMPIFKEIDPVNNTRYLEYNLYSRFDNGKKYFAVQRQYMEAIIS
jgi:hypothetical protein